MKASALSGLFCFGFDGLTVPDTLRSRLAAGLSGVILFARNLHDLEQICRLTSELHAAAARPLLVGVDQEGGRVCRLPEPFVVPPPAAVLGAVGDAELAANVARAVGRELRAAGFTWNLAPVLDVHTNPANRVIGDRAYGADPDRVARLGIGVLRGLADAGILPTAKHFPGHGDTLEDSHTTLPESRQSGARWRAVEFIPFQRAIQAGVPLVLVAHLLCPALDPSAPSSLSRRVVTGILREELGYDGVIVSDDLEMAAIASRVDVGEAAVQFLEAGGDLILICREADRQRAAMAAVEESLRSRRLSEARVAASLDRIARLGHRLPGNRTVHVETARAIVGAPEHRRLLDECLGSRGRSA
jgi:beta-N-acetylhexosaminidase